MTRPIARDPIYRKRAFDADIIELCVRWYITYRLSYRDLVEMMAERGIEVAHSTILRWVTRYVPEFEKRWNRFSRLWPGSSRSRTRPSRSPASSWLIAFASGSSRSVVAVGVVAGPGRRNGRWRSHRSRLGTQNSVIATSMSRVAPEPPTALRGLIAYRTPTYRRTFCRRNSCPCCGP